MNELLLVGYTADLRFLVFSDAGDGTARYKVPVDEDLEATLTEVLQLLDPDRVRPGQATEAPESSPESNVPAAPDLAAAPAATNQRATVGLFDDEDDEELFASTHPSSEPAANGKSKRRARLGSGALAAQALLLQPPEPFNGRPDDVLDVAPRDSKLSPRQIQALLRSGMGVRQVAKRADTDEAWVARWLAPIEAERDLILEAVERCRITKSRLGESRDLVGEAIRKNLAERRIGMDDEHVEWSAARKEGDPHWVVTLRYRSRGRKQRAVWHFNPETADLEARNALATDIAWTRPRGAKKKATAKKPGKTAGARRPAKKASGKASAKKPGKKASAKKSASKRAGAGKTTAKKLAKKTSGKATAKKPAKKSGARKSAKKTSGKASRTARKRQR